MAACTRFPDEGTTKDLSAPAAPVVTIDRQTETSVAFTVAPAAGTGYYSYALLSGAKKSVNANSLLAVNLGGIAEDIANYALPASGNPADLTEDDYIDYDYNFFAIDTQRESAVAKAPVNRAKAKKAGKKPITLTRVK